MDENNKKNGGKPVRLKLGTLSTLMVVLAVAITIVVNMVAENLDLFYDLTPDMMFSISDTSEQILADLEQDVTIYTLFRTGHEPGIYQQFLNRYNSFPMVSVVNVDPFIHADFVERHARPGEIIPVNSLIVESGGRHRVLTPNELRTVRFDFWAGVDVLESITFESAVTNAIRQVASGFDYKIYFVTGHNEVPPPPSLVREFADWHFTLSDLNITMIDRIPDDASALFITTPSRDWNELTTQIVWDYLERGGKAVFFIDFNDAQYTNLRRLVNNFGINFMDDVVLESNPNFLVPFAGGQVNPFALIPMYPMRHNITNDIMNSDFRVALINARPLELTQVARQNLTIEPILATSPDSFIVDVRTLEPGALIQREPTDPSGPFAVMYAVTDRNSSPASRVVFAGTESLLEDVGANTWLVMNAFSWAMDTLPNVWIEAHVVNDNRLEFTNMAQVYFIMGVSLFAIPAAILGTGVVVWLRRRNK